jgi:hypothetical protein
MNEINIKTTKKETSYTDKNGKYHRVDGPAIINYNSKSEIWLEEWFSNGKRHRLDGPAYYHLDSFKGYEEWFIYGLRHRIAGPALINPSYFKKWYKNDMAHRLNAPAVIYNSGDRSYFQFGIEINKKEIDWSKVKF